jgi:hypothetical protein
VTEYLNFEGARLLMICGLKTGVKVVEILRKRSREERGESRRNRWEFSGEVLDCWGVAMLRLNGRWWWWQG